MLPHSVQWEQWSPGPCAGHPSSGQLVRLLHSHGSSFLLLLELPGPGDHCKSLWEQEAWPWSPGECEKAHPGQQHSPGEEGAQKGPSPRASPLFRAFPQPSSRHKGGALLPMHLVLGVPCLPAPLGWPKGSPRAELGVQGCCPAAAGAVPAQGLLSEVSRAGGIETLVPAVPGCERRR